MLPQRGFAYDLAIATAIMAAKGDLPAALAAARAEINTIVVATANQAEATLVPDLTVIADNLTEVAGWLRGGPPPHREPPGPQ